MKMMKFDNRVCTVEVKENFLLEGNVPCPFCRDTLAYALERFFSRNEKARRHGTYISWQLRLGKGKKSCRRNLNYLIPGSLMELAPFRFRVRGYIDAQGVHITSLEVMLRREDILLFVKRSALDAHSSEMERAR